VHTVLKVKVHTLDIAPFCSESPPQRLFVLPTHLLTVIFYAHQHKAAGVKLSKMLNNGCNDFLFGVHCVEEGDRIPPLQSYGQALKQKDCFSGVLGDDCGASAKLLLILLHYCSNNSSPTWTTGWACRCEQRTRPPAVEWVCMDCSHRNRRVEDRR